MRRARLFLLMLLCHVVHAQPVVEWRDLLTETDGAHATVYYRKSDGEALQGEFRIRRGLDEECVRFSNGLMDGAYRRYRDGVLRESGGYVDGLRHGMFREYYPDGTTVRKETPMQSGKIEGTVRTYFRNGEGETEKEYRQSREHGLARRFDYVTGETIMESRYVNGLKEGEETLIEDHGNDLRSKTVRHYRNGKLDGPFHLESTRQGMPYITVTGAYADGKKCGHWTQYDAVTGVKKEWNEDASGEL